MLRPLIHIGYHKTGTTWLQERIFTEPRFGFLRAELRDIDKAFILVNAFAADAASARSHLEPFFTEAEARSLVPVISHERLSGAPLANGLDARLIADRLTDTFPEGRVLIVIREQRDLMLSLYKQNVFVRSGHASFGSFWRQRVRPASDLPQRGIEVFEFHHLIRYYQRIFGVERVLVLPYELLRGDPHRFVSEIATFSGAPQPQDVPVEKEHASLPSASLVLLRYMNAVQSALGLRKLFTGKPEDRPFLRAKIKIVRATGGLAPKGVSKQIDARWRTEALEMTEGRFGVSNRLTEEATGLDLAGYGYDVAPTGTESVSAGPAVQRDAS